MGKIVSAVIVAFIVMTALLDPPASRGGGLMTLEEARLKALEARRHREGGAGTSTTATRIHRGEAKAGDGEHDLVLVAVGDVMLSGAMDGACRRHGYDWPFRPMAKILRGADVATANLECPLTQRGRPMTGKRWIFRASPEAARALVGAGFDLVSLANNHVMDYGPQGMVDTLDACRAAGLATVGAGADLESASRPTVLSRFGRRIAFLGFTKVQPSSTFAGSERPGAATVELAGLKRRVEAARNLAHHVVVWFHWGAEYRVEPSRHMRILAQGALDAGADLVLGGHSHTWGPVELRHGRAAIYGMGNHAFGTSNPRAEVGLMVRAVFRRSGLSSLRVQPLDVRVAATGGAPRPARGELRRVWERRFRGACAALGTSLGAMSGEGIHVPLVVAGDEERLPLAVPGDAARPPLAVPGDAARPPLAVPGDVAFPVSPSVPGDAARPSALRE